MPRHPITPGEQDDFAIERLLDACNDALRVTASLAASLVLVAGFVLMALVSTTHEHFFRGESVLLPLFQVRVKLEYFIVGGTLTVAGLLVNLLFRSFQAVGRLLGFQRRLWVLPAPQSDELVVRLVLSPLAVIVFGHRYASLRLPTWLARVTWLVVLSVPVAGLVVLFQYSLFLPWFYSIGVAVIGAVVAGAAVLLWLGIWPPALRGRRSSRTGFVGSTWRLLYRRYPVKWLAVAGAAVTFVVALIYAQQRDVRLDLADRALCRGDCPMSVVSQLRAGVCVDENPAERLACGRTELEKLRNEVNPVDVEERHLVRVLLSNAILPFAVLNEAHMQEAMLDGAKLHGALLRGAKLHCDDPDGVYCPAASGALLEGAVLLIADLSDADLRGAVLTGAQLDGADLARADLRWLDANGASLRGARLTESCLCGGNLTDVDLSGALLDGSVALARCACKPAEAAPAGKSSPAPGDEQVDDERYFGSGALGGDAIADPGEGAKGPGGAQTLGSYASHRGRRGEMGRTDENQVQAAALALNGTLTLEGARMLDGDWRAVRFPEGGSLAGSCLALSDLRQTCLDDVSLREGRLQLAQLDGARLGRSDLSFAKLDHASLNGVRATGVMLRGASLRHVVAAPLKTPADNGQAADFAFADLSAAQLAGASFKDARLVGASLEDARVSPAGRAALDGSCEAPALAEQKEADRARWGDAARKLGGAEQAALGKALLEALPSSPERAAFGALAQAPEPGADFSGADLRGASLRGSPWWSSFDLAGADLRWVDLRVGDRDLDAARKRLQAQTLEFRVDGVDAPCLFNVAIEGRCVGASDRELSDYDAKLAGFLLEEVGKLSGDRRESAWHGLRERVKSAQTQGRRLADILGPKLPSESARSGGRCQ